VDHADHVGLIRLGVEGAPDGPWADLGAGAGAFTLALADLLGPGGRITAVDRGAADLRENERRVRAAFPATDLATLAADFTRPLPLETGTLAGLVMANALHFVERRRQPDVVRSVAALLRPGGRFVLVEYDTDRGNHWVPHPMTLPTWRRIAEDAGLTDVRPTGRVPSRFLGAIHAAVAAWPG
jgi:ubiquinone/menaquinone biosynthesis C-methylase UbiE